MVLTIFAPVGEGSSYILSVQKRMVVVSSPGLAKQVLSAHDQVMANRPPLCFASLMFPDDIAFHGRSPAWSTRRKICIVHLFTAKRIQDLQHVRHHEIAALLQRFHQHAATAPTTPVDVGHCVDTMSSAIILRLLHSRPETIAAGEDLALLIRQMEQSCVPTTGDLIPCLSFLDFIPKCRMRCLHARMDMVLTAILAERKESEGQHDDLLEALLSYHDHKEGMPATAHKEALTLDEIKSIMTDMLAAGIHTTALTLEWAMAELLKNPRCFRRLQEEIDEALADKKQQVTDVDLPKLPYLKCVVREVFRLHPVGPLLLPRISRGECKLDGYTIPANTLVHVNVWAMGRDEQVWARANDFIPERFENKDIDLKGQHFELLPFGSGRRVCPGLLLGLTIVEITLANFVKQFNWELPFGETPQSLNMEEKIGLAINRAHPLLAIPKPRLYCST